MKPGEITFIDFPGQIIWREPMPDRDPILTEREKTHGDFTRGANIWHYLMEAHPLPENHRQAHALTMIYTKLSRLLQNPDVKDHWDDIAGYAHLGAEACPKTD